MAGSDEQTFRGESFDDRFEIVASAGSGGMGKVFEALDRATGARIALKVVTGAGDRVRFRAEAEILETLAHPAIVKYVAHGVTSDDHPYLAMEWLVGESLSHRLKLGRLTITETIVLGERLADALAHAHALGVVHRDLKPSNIFLVEGRSDLARLIDFGVAKTGDRDLTQTGQLIGTPGYMSPEQVRGEKTVDRRSDVFALGCVLYEALTGKPPYEGGEIMEVITRLLLEKPARIEATQPDVPLRLVHLIDAMLIKDQGKRLGDCAVVRDELATIHRALAVSDHDTLAERSPKVPIAPAEDSATLARPTFAIASHASTIATVVERPNRRPERVKKNNARLWLAIALGGAVIGSAATAYFVMREDETEATAPTPEAPVCTSTMRTGCGALCSTGDGAACFFHGEALLAGRTDTVNREPAIDAYHRGCDLGFDRGCVAGAELLLRDGANLGEADLAYGMLAKGCEHSQPESCRRLGDEYRAGGAWEGDDESAFELIAKACEANDATACGLLDDMIKNGEGTRALRRDAGTVRQAACARGISDACR